jgi:hypothetical protein
LPTVRHPFVTNTWILVVALGALSTACAPSQEAEIGALQTLENATEQAETSVGQLAMIAYGVRNGDIDFAELAPAREAADRDLLAFGSYADEISPETGLTSAVGAVQTTATEIIDALDAGDVVGAAGMARTNFVEQVRTLEDLIDQQVDARHVAERSAQPSRVFMILALGIGVATVAATLLMFGKRGLSKIRTPGRGRRAPAPEPIPADTIDRPDNPAPSTTATRVPELPAPPAMADLHNVIEAALRPLEAAGWDASFECPPVAVAVDSDTLSSVLTGMLTGAGMSGAENIGIVTDIAGDKVRIRIAFDGPGAGEGEITPEESERRLGMARAMLGDIDADVDWTRVGKLALFTLELNGAPVGVGQPGVTS